MRKRTSWHYRRLIKRYEKQATSILSGLINDRHAEAFTRLEGPDAEDAEGRALRRGFFRAVLQVEVASLLVRRPSIVRELLALYEQKCKPLETGPDGLPVFPVVELEEDA